MKDEKIKTDEKYWDNKTNMDWREITEDDEIAANERVRELIEKSREELD